MANSRPLLERLLNTPDLPRIIPRLQPEVLHRVIQTWGLEDCAEVVGLATPEQISRVLDLDLWRVRSRGGDEELDSDRFGLWLDVLMQSGAEVAAHKLVGLDVELVTAGLSQHVAVLNSAAVAAYTTLDGELIPARKLSGDTGCEIGGYAIEGKRSTAWDPIVELLTVLSTAHAEYFGRLMAGCLRLSNGARELDASHDLLQDADQDMFDLAAERETRREKQGYATPAQARAFLDEARQLRLVGDPPLRSPIAQAYFRAIEPTPSSARDTAREPAGMLPEASSDVTSDIESVAIAEVVEVLREAGVFTVPPRGLLEAAQGETAHLTWVRSYVQSHAASAEELAYLTNALLAGCSIQDRALTAPEAADAVAATCNLGLDNWPRHWRDRDLITAFQVGWTILHRDVCLYTAKQLIRIVANLECVDRDIQLQLNGLRRELKKHVRDRMPWRARNALEVLMLLDAPSWAALRMLLDECPATHGAVHASRRRSHAINATDFDFISENTQIAVIREFLKSLPAALAQ